MRKQEQGTCLYSNEHLKKFHKIVSEHKIIYINASFGWCKADFMREYLERIYKKNHYWVEDGQTCMQMHNAECGQGRPSFLILRYFERIASGSQLDQMVEYLKQLPQGFHAVILSSVPVPKRMLPITLNRNFIRIGEEQLRPERDEVRQFFREQGIVVSDYELAKIERDFDNMPLCLQVLGNCLKEQERGYCSLTVSQCRQDLYAYLEVSFFQALPLKIQDILLRLAYFEEISAGLLEAVFDMSLEMGRKFLQDVLERGSILKEGHDRTYVFFPLMQGFLQRYVEKYVGGPERAGLYQKAADYYISCEAYEKALGFIAVQKEEHGLAECLSRVLELYPEPARFRELEPYFEMLSKNTILRYPALIAGKAMLEGIYGNRRRAFEWYERLDAASALVWQDYLRMFLPVGTEAALIRRMKAAQESVSFRWRQNPYAFVTSDYPSVLHGGRDFSDLARHSTDGGSAYHNKNSDDREGLDAYCYGMGYLALGELWYERNQFDMAMEYIVHGLNEARRSGTVPLIFAGTAALCNVMLHSSQPENMGGALENAERLIEQEGSWLLQGNFKALLAQYDLVLGNQEQVDVWMQKWAPDENRSFCGLLRFQYLVKARVYLWKKQYVCAQNVLNLLREYALDFELRYLEIQVYILESILYFRKGNSGHYSILEKALRLGEELNFIRVFADEGAAVYPLLQEERCRVRGNNAFLESTIKAAKNTMLLYPGYLTRGQQLEELSEAELQVLRLLVCGKKNGEIAQSLYVSENTVKYHLKNIYLKMDVKSRSQAVKLAVEYNVV